MSRENNIIRTAVLPGRTISHNGEEFLYFSGTSYLGICQLAEFKELIKTGLDRVGTHFGGSRLSNIQVDIFAETEKKLAELCGAPGALLFSSGSFAGYSLTEIVPENSEILIAPGTHSALWKNFTPPPQTSRQKWEADCLDQLEKTDRPVFVLTNTVDPLFCKDIDMSWLENANRPERITVIADDSHGIGVLGPDGGGSYSKWAAGFGGQTIFMGSLGKGIGIPAGYVLAQPDTIAALKSTRTFGGSSPPNPAFLYAWFHGEDIYKRQLQKLRKHISLFHKKTQTENLFHFQSGFPVFHCKQPETEQILSEEKIIISSFNYPGPGDPKVTRAVLNALHEEEDILRLCEVLE